MTSFVAPRFEETLIGKLRRKFNPRIPKILSNLSTITIKEGETTTSVNNELEIAKLFPLTFGQRILDMQQKSDHKNNTDHQPPENEMKYDHRILRLGVVLSGGQAAGGHNVITGIFDAITELNKYSTLIGFIG